MKRRTPSGALATVRRRDFLVGATTAALFLGVRLPNALAQAPNVNAACARRLTRGLTASFWFEWAPTEPAAMKRYIATRYEPEDFAQIRGLGFDHVRVSIQPDFLAPKLDTGDADLSAERLALFDDAIAGILRNGLAVVLDNHASSKTKDKMAANVSFRNAVAQWWRNFAGHIARHGQYRPDTTFLEILNEPEQSFGDVEQYRTMIGGMISAIRAAAPDYTLIVGGNQWNIAEAIFRDLETPFPDPNLIYTFHFYQPMQFTHQGEENAGPVYGKLKGVPWGVGPEAISEVEIASADPSVQPALRAYNWKSHRRRIFSGHLESSSPGAERMARSHCSGSSGSTAPQRRPRIAPRGYATFGSSRRSTVSGGRCGRRGADSAFSRTETRGPLASTGPFFTLWGSSR